MPIINICNDGPRTVLSGYWFASFLIASAPRSLVLGKSEMRNGLQTKAAKGAFSGNRIAKINFMKGERENETEKVRFQRSLS